MDTDGEKRQLPVNKVLGRCRGCTRIREQFLSITTKDTFARKEHTGRRQDRNSNVGERKKRASVKQNYMQAGRKPYRFVKIRCSLVT